MTGYVNLYFNATILLKYYGMFIFGNCTYIKHSYLDATFTTQVSDSEKLQRIAGKISQ